MTRLKEGVRWIGPLRPPGLNEPAKGLLKGCEIWEGNPWAGAEYTYLYPVIEGVASAGNYDENWADAVRPLIESIASQVAFKKSQELQSNVLQIAIAELDKRLHRLESVQAKIAPIGSFAPEPYGLLKPILVAIHSIEGGFNACWFDANIHASGDNEEEAVCNLKSLILDFFDTYSNESANGLGPEPTRQLAVLREYIQKKP